MTLRHEESKRGICFDQGLTLSIISGEMQAPPNGDFCPHYFSYLKKKGISFGGTRTLPLTKQLPKVEYLTLNEINLILSDFPYLHRKSVEQLKRGSYISYVF